MSHHPIVQLKSPTHFIMQSNKKKIKANPSSHVVIDRVASNRADQFSLPNISQTARHALDISIYVIREIIVSKRTFFERIVSGPHLHTSGVFPRSLSLKVDLGTEYNADTLCTPMRRLRQASRVKQPPFAPLRNCIPP